MIGGTAILLLAGVFLCGGFLQAIHPVAGTARQGGWLGGEGYSYRGGAISGDGGMGLLTGAEWERMARFARARSEMEGGNLRSAESLWTEYISEEGDSGRRTTTAGSSGSVSERRRKGSPISKPRRSVARQAAGPNGTPTRCTCRSSGWRRPPGSLWGWRCPHG